MVIFNAEALLVRNEHSYATKEKVSRPKKMEVGLCLLKHNQLLNIDSPNHLISNVNRVIPNSTTHVTINKNVLTKMKNDELKGELRARREGVSGK